MPCITLTNQGLKGFYLRPCFLHHWWNHTVQSHTHQIPAQHLLLPPALLRQTQLHLAPAKFFHHQDQQPISLAKHFTFKIPLYLLIIAQVVSLQQKKFKSIISQYIVLFMLKMSIANSRTSLSPILCFLKVILHRKAAAF